MKCSMSGSLSLALCKSLWDNLNCWYLQPTDAEGVAAKGEAHTDAMPHNLKLHYVAVILKNVYVFVETVTMTQVICQKKERKKNEVPLPSLCASRVNCRNISVRQKQQNQEEVLSSVKFTETAHPVALSATLQLLSESRVSIAICEGRLTIFL